MKKISKIAILATAIFAIAAPAAQASTSITVTHVGIQGTSYFGPSETEAYIAGVNGWKPTSCTTSNTMDKLGNRVLLDGFYAYLKVHDRALVYNQLFWYSQMPFGKNYYPGIYHANISCKMWKKIITYSHGRKIVTNKYTTGTGSF